MLRKEYKRNGETRHICVINSKGDGGLRFDGAESNMEATWLGFVHMHAGLVLVIWLAWLCSLAASVGDTYFVLGRVSEWESAHVLYIYIFFFFWGGGGGCGERAVVSVPVNGKSGYFFNWI